MPKSIDLFGGDALVAKLAEISRKVSGSDTLRVGFLENATYPTGQKVAFVAAMNEFGHSMKTASGMKYVPPRPFFRNTITKQNKSWALKLGRLIVANHYGLSKTFNQLGEVMKDDIQAGIREFDSVPLAPVTVERKGFSKQLIDTAHMLNSVAYEVKS